MIQAVPGNVADTLKELSNQLNSAHRLLADSIQQDGAPQLAAVGALEIASEVSAALQLASDHLRSYLSSFHTAITIAEIQRQVAGCFGIPLIEMKSDRRAREVARPRQIAMYLAKTITGQSMAVIGAKFGGRDHTTVTHAIKRVENLMALRPEFARAIADIRRELTTAPAPDFAMIFEEQGT